MFNASIRRFSWFEWADPGIAIDVEACVAGLDNVACGKSGAANDVAHVLGKNFFVTNAILDGADGAILAENVSGLFDGGARVRALGGHDSEVAARNFARIGSRVQTHGKIGRAADAQASLVYCASVFFPDVIRMDFDIIEPGEMSAKDASDCTAAYYANLCAHAVFNASIPV